MVVCVSSDSVRTASLYTSLRSSNPESCPKQDAPVVFSSIKVFHADGSCNIRSVCPVGAVSKIILSKPVRLSSSVMKFENSLNAAISTVHEPESCSSMLAITLSGNFPLNGLITDSLYSAAACSGSRFTTVKLGTSLICVPLLFKSILKTSCKLEAGSVLIKRTFLPLSARFTAVAQAIDVLPTPPLPVKNIYFV